MQSLSAKKLLEYNYGVHKDNYLTYSLRYNKMDAFKYLLKRKGVTSLVSNDEGKNIIHFAVETNNLNALIYLCEGKWESSLGNESSKQSKVEWIEDSWKALDTVTIAYGYLPFHLSIVHGYKDIFQYILKVVEYRSKKSDKYMTLKELLEFQLINGISIIK